MSEKKLPCVLTSAAVASLLFLTSAAGYAAEGTHWRPEGRKGIAAAESRWDQIWELLPRLWQQAVSPMGPAERAGKTRSTMDPEGLTQKVRSTMDPEG